MVGKATKGRCETRGAAKRKEQADVVLEKTPGGKAGKQKASRAAVEQKKRKLEERFAVPNGGFAAPERGKEPPPEEDECEDECEANTEGQDFDSLRAQLEEMSRKNDELQKRLTEAQVPMAIGTDNTTTTATAITRESNMTICSNAPTTTDATQAIGSAGSMVVPGGVRQFLQADGLTAGAAVPVIGTGIANTVLASSVLAGSVRAAMPELSEAQQMVILDEKEMHETLKDQLEKYVNRSVFSSTKFQLGEEKERKLCRIAVYKGKVQLPFGVSREVFGRKFSSVIRKRMNKIRSNTHGAARAKFESDWRAGRVPDNLVEKLNENYRDYLDGNGTLIPEREENFKAFVYFVDRILTSVNAKVNDYSPRIRKKALLKSVYSVSDEAFALITLENYCTRWIRMLEAQNGGEQEDFSEGDDSDGPVPLDKTTMRKSKWFEAKYTSSQRGKSVSGWTQEGISRFTDIAEKVKSCRMDNRMGEELEQYLVTYWIGHMEAKSGKERPEVIEAFTDNDLFGGDVEEI